jgi:2-polyprenyl-3-methyl-5-hydroxy-6-metoxy-1,4-benzoquinol methylase
VRGRPDLSPDASAARFAEELRQGELIAEGHEDAWGWNTPAGRLRADRRAEFMISATGLAPGVTCLELGAGTGEFTERLAASGCDLTAVEISPTTAARCRERVPAAEVVVGNIETGEGLEGRRFDAVVGVSVLHHVNLESCLTASLGLLRPGGRFAFSEPNMRNPQVWAERNVAYVRRKRHVTAHETAFRAEELRAAFEDAGFVVDRCEPFEFLHPATPERAIPALLALERGLDRTPVRRIAGSLLLAGRARD